ncbi:MAG: glycine zipper 2TM domain-containing protein [Methylotenera sp.]|nr:glycine zipper 2TM domain-containing protein [Methylotenera sp.]
MLIPTLLLVASLPAMADQYNDSARVLSVTPQTDRVNLPRQECHTEYQQQSYSNGSSPIGAIIGGIAGGLLGNTVGRGNGRIAATAVGAGVGAVAGNRIGNNNNGATRTVPVQSCYQVENWQTVNTGYLVVYEYNGRTYTTVTNTPPGKYIDVDVAVAPNGPVISQNNYDDDDGYNYGYDDRRDHGRHRGWDRHN